jgi:transcriptional regulator with XRE-family HTH domain
VTIRARKAIPEDGDYGPDVPPPLDVRRKAFAAFVRRALRNAKEDRGWGISRVAEEAGIGGATIYRWRDGDWNKAPSPDAVVAFCDALDIDPKHAFAILWPGKGDDAPPPEPAPLDRDIELLARRLRDPNVTEAEKVSIRATIRFLIGRSQAPAPTE